MNNTYRIGMQVLASDGDAGVVEDILSTDRGAPRYLVVRDRGVFASDVVLPLDGTTSDGVAVHVALTRQQVHAAERYDVHRHGEAAGWYSMSARAYDQSDDDDKGAGKP
jgi:hypothetical protein